MNGRIRPSSSSINKPLLFVAVLRESDWLGGERRELAAGGPDAPAESHIINMDGNP